LEGLGAERVDWVPKKIPSDIEVDAMRIEYDKETDSLKITLRNARIKESDEVRPGVIADFGYDGGIVSFEVMEASKVVEQTGEMQFAVA
jgi:uncharacterized protein YuzE